MTDRMESDNDSRKAAPEDCLLCSSPIGVGADTMTYAGLRVHPDCYWRDIGVPPKRKGDSQSFGFRFDE